MRINRIPRLPGRAELPTAPNPAQLLARALRGIGCSLRRAVLTWHIRNARHEIQWLDELMQQDRIDLLAAHGLHQSATAHAIHERQMLDAAQRAFLIKHLARLRAQRAALDAAA